MNRTYQNEYLRRVAIDCVMEQLKLRGEVVVRARSIDRHDVIIKDKDIKIRVKFSKPVKRSRIASLHWEFTKVMHIQKLWPRDVFDSYILVGFNNSDIVEKVWKILVDDDIIYRKNQLFIPIDGYSIYNKYELDILINDSSSFRWID